MSCRAIFVLIVGLLSVPVSAADIKSVMNPKTDALVSNFDSRPDVDDLHSIAALATILRHQDFKAVRYLAVAGAYGEQGGTYIDSPELFNLAFADNWVDAHHHREQALKRVAAFALETLQAGGDVWMQDAGQADFSADVLKELRRLDSSLDAKRRVHIVQHSVWNEEASTDDKLLYARNYAHYVKIPDGNGSGNGTPNYRNSRGDDWPRVLSHEAVGQIWKEAKRVADQYNGKTEYDNMAIMDGGFDFSDTVEVIWILGVEDVDTVEAFFNRFLP